MTYADLIQEDHFGTPRFRAGAKQEDFASFASVTGIELPEEFKDFLRHSDGAHGNIGEHGDWIRLDSLADIAGYAMSFQFAEWHILQIGSTGGDEGYGLDLRYQPPRYYRYLLSGTSKQFLGHSLLEMLQHVAARSKPGKPEGGKIPKKPRRKKEPPPKATFIGDAPGLIKQIRGFGGPGVMANLAIMPDNTLLLVGSWPVKVCDIRKGKILHEITDIDRDLHAVGVTSSGQALAVVRKYDPALAIPDKNRFCVHVWDLLEKKKLASHLLPERVHVGGINHTEFSPNGRWVLYVDAEPPDWRDIDSFLWDLANNTLVGRLNPISHRFGWTADNHLIIGRLGGEAAILDPAKPEEARSIRLPRAIQKVACHADGRFAVSMGDTIVDGVLEVSKQDDVYIYSHLPRDGSSKLTESLAIVLPYQRVDSLCWLGSTDRLAIGTQSGPILIYNAATGEKLLEFNNSKEGNRALSVSADGRLMASVGDKFVKIWRV